MNKEYNSRQRKIYSDYNNLSSEKLEEIINSDKYMDSVIDIIRDILNDRGVKKKTTVTKIEKRPIAKTKQGEHDILTTKVKKADSLNEILIIENEIEVNSPNICPCCSRIADEETEVYWYDFKSSTGEMILFGLIGQLFKFVTIGSDKETILKVRICKTHNNQVNFYKVLEWLTRGAGILLTVKLLINNTTTESPLFSRDFTTILAVFLPLILAGIFSLIFRHASDNAKGISYLGIDGKYNKFSVKNPNWVKECNEINSTKE